MRRARHVIDQVLAKEYDLVKYLMDDHSRAQMAIDLVDSVGFVATSLSSTKPALLIVGCVWNKYILYKRKRGHSWSMESIRCPIDTE
jgi:hypothetical protein